MSDKRKLLAEVDRTLKKIQEGMDIFDEIWAKVQEAPTQSHKEKYEQDLKKEIKKLQRLRDQIKTWIASSNEIKDKDPLLKARRDIETKMEKFKDVERETKTKVYSKVGLAQAAKMDINQKKKYEARTSLSEFIDKMKCDLEQFESEMEDLELGARKKKLEKDKQEKVDFLRAITESHHTHITKMEIMLRMLDNDSLDPDTVFGLTDDFKFYLDKSDEGHIEDVGYIYEGIDLEETEVESPPPSPEPSVTSKDSDDAKKKRPDELTTTPGPLSSLVHDGITKIPSAKIPIPLRIDTNSTSKPADGKPSVGMSPPPKNLSQSLPTNATMQQPPLLQAYAAAAAKALPQTLPKQPPQVPSPALAEEPEPKKADQERLAVDLQAAAVANIFSQAAGDNHSRRPSVDTQFNAPTKPSTPIQFPLSASPRPQAMLPGSYASSIASSAPVTPQPSPMKDPWKDITRTLTKPTVVIQNGPQRIESSQQQFTVPVHSSMMQQQSVSQSTARSEERNSSAHEFVLNSMIAVSEASARSSEDNQVPSFTVGHSTNSSDDFGGGKSESASRVLSATSPVLSLRNSSLMSDSPSAPSVPLITKSELEARITPMLAMVPLGAERTTRDMMLQHNWLEAAFHSPPKPCDSERRKAFIPCTHCQTPAGWPRQPPFPLVCDMKFYGGLANDALFFIFYFQEGSLAQVLAAKALKSKNWRFHKQQNAWFQRLEEPKVTTAEFERGNYKYWDLDTWSEKQKNDFTFEYRYLENVDLNRWPYV